MSGSETKLRERLLEYYKKEENLKVLFDVLNKRTSYSLRVIEWFVTNYCKKHTFHVDIGVRKPNQ